MLMPPAGTFVKPTATRANANWLGTSQGLEALVPTTTYEEPNMQTPSVQGVGPLPHWGGVNRYRNSVIDWQERDTLLADDTVYGGQYGVALYTANASGQGGIVPQPMIVSRRAYLPRVGLIAMSQNRQPFPANRIIYTGAAPNAIFPTITKPYPWAVPPYVAPFLTPSAPGGSSGGFSG
jgi:hypothetical protein